MEELKKLVMFSKIRNLGKSQHYGQKSKFGQGLVKMESQ